MTTPQNIADLMALSRLLDHALDLAPHLTEPWVARLPPEVTHLAPRLRRLLDEHRAGACTDFMAGSPQLDDDADETTFRPGDMAGPYRLLREVGRGGMCTVWLAERDGPGAARPFAVKLPRRAPDAGVIRRMAEERDITALMDHPAVARLRDAGSDDTNRPYLVLDYVPGLALDAWCKSKQPGAADRLRLFLQVVRAVAHVHGHGVVHRDLKPANVLVGEDGRVHVLDFGIACRLCPAEQTETNAIIERSLTPSYASPEQRRGEATTYESDVYSLGVMLFELMTGALPRPRVQGPFTSNESRGPKRVRADLGDILHKALAPRPEQRHANASALADDIQRILGALASAASPDRGAGSRDRLVGTDDSSSMRPRQSAAWRGATRRPRPAMAGTAALHLPKPGGKRNDRWNAT